MLDRPGRPVGPGPRAPRLRRAAEPAAGARRAGSTCDRAVVAAAVSELAAGGRLAPALVRRAPAALRRRRRARRRGHLAAPGRADQPCRRTSTCGRRLAVAARRWPRPGRRDDVEALAAELESLGDDVPTELVDDERRWPAGARSTCPPTYAALAETRDTAAGPGGAGRRTGAEGRRVDLWARIEGVDLAEQPLERARPRPTAPPLEVEPRPRTARPTAGPGARFQSAAEGAVAGDGPGAARASSRVEARVGGAGAVGARRGPATHGRAPDGSGPVGPRRHPRRRPARRPAGPAGGRAPAPRPGHRPRRRARPRRHRRLRHSARPLRAAESGSPTAVYHLHRAGGLGVAAAWRERLPVEVRRRPHHRLRVLPGGRRSGRAPPRPAPRRRRARRLRPAAAAGGVRRRRRGRRDPTLWYFESFAGRSATDTPLAVFEELRRRAPGARAWPGGSSTTATGRPPGATAGRDRLPRVVRRAGHGPGPGHQHRARGVVPPAARPARRPVLPRLPVEGDGRVAVAGPRAAAAPGRGDAAPQRRDVGPDLDADPGDDRGLPRAVRLHGPAAEHGYPRNDALRGPTPTRTRLRDRARPARHTRRTRRPCSTHPPGATTSPRGRARRR